MITTWVCVLGAAGCVIAIRPHSWHPLLFVWGLALGGAGLLAQHLSSRRIDNLPGMSADEVAAIRHRTSTFRRSAVANSILLGVILAVGSAVLNFAWLDVAGTIYIAFVWLASYLAVSLTLRNRRRSPSGGE
jgi:hypothetical protein